MWTPADDIAGTGATIPVWQGRNNAALLVTNANHNDVAVTLTPNITVGTVFSSGTTLPAGTYELTGNITMNYATANMPTAGDGGGRFYISCNIQVGTSNNRSNAGYIRTQPPYAGAGASIAQVVTITTPQVVSFTYTLQRQPTAASTYSFEIPAGGANLIVKRLQ